MISAEYQWHDAAALCRSMQAAVCTCFSAPIGFLAFILFLKKRIAH
jgi:hypothetical protein